MPVPVQSSDQGHQSLQDNFLENFEINPPPIKLKTDVPTDEEFKLYIREIEKELAEKHFNVLPRGIHQAEAIRFNKEILQAPTEVIQILQDGYIPQYTERPDSICLLNNKSALKKMDFCVSQVIKYIFIIFYKPKNNVFSF